MGQIIGSAFSDAWPLFMSRKIVYVVLMLIAAVCWIFALNLPPAVTINYGPTMDPRVSVAIDVASGLGGLAAWFVLPAVVRTIDPSFRMTIGRFFGVLGLAIVIGVVVGVAMGVLYGLGFWLMTQGSSLTSILGVVCMIDAIVFVLWIGIRWSQVIWSYFLGEPPNPFAASWHVTSGQFWPTLGFVIVLSILTSIVLAIFFGIAGFLVVALPVAGFVAVPLAMAGYIWLLNVVYLAEIRWFVHLREHASGPAGIHA